jgi:hypothetical protein
VHVYNRTKSKTDALIAKGATWHDTPGAVAAQSDLIITMVGFPSDVEEVYFGENGIIASAKEAILVDMTTSSPSLARKIAQEAAKKGLSSIDAPVSGGDIGARDAKLTIMVGGEQEVFNQQSKLISKINKNIGIQVYYNFVPNYKTLATISQIFNKTIPENQKILLENEMVGTLTAKLIKEEKRVEQIDKLTFKVAIQKFNTEYSTKVLPEQKDLLHKFINHAEDDIELKVYLSEEIQRIKGEIEQIRDNDIIKESTELSEKVKILHEAVSTFKFNRVNEKIVEKMLTIYEFLHEVKS